MAVAVGLLPGCGEPYHTEREWPAGSTTLSVELYMAGEQDAERALEDIAIQVDQVREAMGFDGDGELALLNREATEGYYAVQDRDLYRLLKLALDYAQVTRGAYDPTVGPLVRLYGRSSGRAPTPTEIAGMLERVGWSKVAVASEARAVRFRQVGMELYLDRLVEAFALDAASRAFARPGSRGGVLQLRDHYLVWGQPPGRDEWTVDLDDPRQPGSSLCRLTVANRGVSVTAQPPTGDIEATVLDVRTGRPAASDLLAAVAVADSVADAAAMSAALFVTGSTGSGELLAKTHRVEAVLLAEGNGEPYVVVSASLQGKLELPPALEAEIEGRVRYILPPMTMEMIGPLSTRGR